MKQQTEIKRKEKGAIMVETAMILPLLVLLLTGAFDLGLVAHRHQVLQNAVREAARYSAQHRIGVHNVAVSTIQDFVVNYCAAQNMTVANSDVTVSQDHSYQFGGTPVTTSRIAVTYSHSIITPGMSTLLGSPINLSAESVFRNLF